MMLNFVDAFTLGPNVSSSHTDVNLVDFIENVHEQVASLAKDTTDVDGFLRILKVHFRDD